MPILTREDPTLRRARIEGWVIFASWATCMIYCCSYCYWNGYSRADRMLGPGDLRSIGGIPSWTVWGVFVPWVVCSIFNVVFVSLFMTNDSLGPELGEPKADLDSNSNSDLEGALT